MHKFTLSKEIIETTISRRGKLHPYDKLDGNKTALVVIDMQNAFVKKGAGHAWVPEAASTCENINTIARKIRKNKGLVIWIKNTFEHSSLKNWSHFHEHLSSKKTFELRKKSMQRNSFGHEIYDELIVEKNDIILEKYFYSAFIQGSSNINSILKDNKIENILIVGTATNVCCESSARDSMMLNYKTIMISDACSANSDKQHEASLYSFIVNFGDVRTTNEITEIIY